MLKFFFFYPLWCWSCFPVFETLIWIRLFSRWWLIRIRITTFGISYFTTFGISYFSHLGFSEPQFSIRFFLYLLLSYSYLSRTTCYPQQLFSKRLPNNLKSAEIKKPEIILLLVCSNNGLLFDKVHDTQSQRFRVWATPSAGIALFIFCWVCRVWLYNCTFYWLFVRPPPQKWLK